MALGSHIPQGYLKGKNSFLVSAKVIWSILVALERRVVYNKALKIADAFPYYAFFIGKSPRFCAVIRFGRIEGVMRDSR